MIDLTDVLQPGDFFGRTTFHMLVRGDEPIFIFVHEILFGENAGKFLAHPSLFFGGFKKEDAAIGDSQDEALRNCLRLVKDKQPHEMNELYGQLKKAGLL